MIGKYIKTSVRNLILNKLFSAINIAGLAISMSVGLLLIAFIMIGFQTLKAANSTPAEDLKSE